VAAIIHQFASTSEESMGKTGRRLIGYTAPTFDDAETRLERHAVRPQTVKPYGLFSHPSK
jgi:hypothetical protein